MASKVAADLLKDFSSHLRFTDATRRRMEALHSSGDIPRKDIEIVYSGLYLDAFTAFERFIEEMFVGMLAGKVVHRLKSVRPRATFTTREALWGIVIGPRYADWLPYDKTEKRAEAFYCDGLPFTRLTNVDKKRIEALISLRHVLAHKSYHATKQFEEKLLFGLTLTPKERTPSGFLRSVYTSVPARTRYEEAVGDLQKFAEKIC